MSVAYVITSIQPPTPGVEEIARRATRDGSRLFVLGDRKSPSNWTCAGADYLDFEAQQKLPFNLARELPANTYGRKMLGYLLATEAGFTSIRETDDDNAPLDEFFSAVPESVLAREVREPTRFINIYAFFTERPIWPRGLPLAHSRSEIAPTIDCHVSGPLLLQAVANGDPDVDAIYRLTAPDTSPVTFRQDQPLAVRAGTWTPFNSQATTWPQVLLPLMYLPSTCSFRMTDIWRSYIAQRLAPGLGASLVITGPTVYQDRNEHDLMRDFSDEIEGYVGYERFVEVLETTSIAGNGTAVLDDLRIVYEALVAANFFTADELSILDAWLADMVLLGFGART